MAELGVLNTLTVLRTGSYGVILDGGPLGDVLLPRREAPESCAVGDTLVVFVYVDSDNTLVATTQRPLDYVPHQQVDLLVCEHTDIGYKAIINQRLTGYIKKLREDGKIDLVLQPPGYAKMEDIAGELLEKIRAAGGFIAVTDKSPPEKIYALFGVSKKVFKQAVSALYRERLITIEADGLHLVR